MSRNCKEFPVLLRIICGPAPRRLASCRKIAHLLLRQSSAALSRRPPRPDADLLSPSSRSWDPAAADVPGAVLADHGRAGIGLVPNRSGRLGRHNRGGIDLGL